MRFFATHAHKSFLSANITSSDTSAAADAVPSQCRTIAIEPLVPMFLQPGLPDWAHETRTGSVYDVGSSAQFWHAYTHVIVMRDPVDRFLSFVEHLIWMFAKPRMEELLPRALYWEPKKRTWYRRAHYALHIFHTQVLVPGLRQRGPKTCGLKDVALAMGTLSKFHIILNIDTVDTRKASELVIERTLGLNSLFTNPQANHFRSNSDEFKASRARRMNVSADLVQAMRAANRICDIPLVESAKALLLQRAAAIRTARVDACRRS